MNRKTIHLSKKWGNEIWHQHKDLSHEIEIDLSFLHLPKQRGGKNNLSNDLLNNSLPHIVKEPEDVIHVKEKSSKRESISTTIVSTSARRRLLRDFYRLQCDPPSGVSAAPIDSDITRWKGVIFGPDRSSWEGGIFEIGIKFEKNYPFIAPSVRFLTKKMFHPNVGPTGEISLDILGNSWNPAYDIVAILLLIQNLLREPNPMYTADLEASLLFSENKAEYNRRIQEMVKRSWVHESGR